MHLEIQTHRKSPIGLLRQSVREDGKVKKIEYGRLTGLSLDTLKMIQATIQGETVPVEEFEIIKVKEYGASHLLLWLVKDLGLDKMIYSRTSESWVKLVIGMIIGRILYQGSKLSLTRTLGLTSLWEELGVEDLAGDVNHLYAAMDQLSRRQPAIQKKIVNKHLSEKTLLLYDITSSYLVGDYESSDLVRFGYNRDRKKGFPQIVIGLLCNHEGCPLGVEVFSGNTKDASTVPEQIDRFVHDYGFKQLTCVGDRGMLGPDTMETLVGGLDEDVQLTSITALTHAQIKHLCQEHWQDGIPYDQFPLEVSSKDFPGKRLVVYYNEQRAQEHAETREQLLKKTGQALEEVQNRKRPVDDGTVGVRVGKVINKYKVGKLIRYEIKDGKLTWGRDQEKIEEESRYDGVYAIVTDVIEEELTSEEVVEAYRKLATVEQAFQTLKGDFINLRPIYHQTDERIKTHVFICFLAYYLLWHLNQRLKPMFEENTTSHWQITQADIFETMKLQTKNTINFMGHEMVQVSQPTAKQKRIIQLIRQEV